MSEKGVFKRGKAKPKRLAQTRVAKTLRGDLLKAFHEAGINDAQTTEKVVHQIQDRLKRRTTLSQKP